MSLSVGPDSQEEFHQDSREVEEIVPVVPQVKQFNVCLISMY